MGKDNGIQAPKLIGGNPVPATVDVANQNQAPTALVNQNLTSEKAEIETEEKTGALRQRNTAGRSY